VNELHDFGIHLGISFQMMDDILDMTGKAEVMGKPMLKDLQNNAANIVLIHALTHADAQRRNTIRSMMARSEYGLTDPVVVQGILDDLGSVRYASEYCVRHASMARAKLGSLPETKAKHSLEELTYWLEGRRR
jgi:geranylgeranyl pyrophosphate synthase